MVVGKPVTGCDSLSGGHVEPSLLGEWASRAKEEIEWEAGIATWHYSRDSNGDFIRAYQDALEDDTTDPTPPHDPTPPS